MGELFDELAKALASGVSRREALKRFAAGILGGIFATKAASPEVAEARRKRKVPKACKKFCKGFSTSELERQCRQDAKKKTGACFQCGPKAPDDSQVLCGDVCCPRESCVAVSGGGEECIVVSS